ncbi:vacuolar-sorting protein SNF8 isoform X1 [Heterocephalus glaber]|uniref:Vacuolar-sorting protein SNF8 n=1 Tax=Heterocephalus glaber TaxID=10181 RepID=A0AAX6RE10_HETGA|nr:vacuolar-sorting protein SNF8 isoform X1 [Heterocephalus glaber]
MRNPGLPGWEPGPKRDAASGGPGGGAGRGPRSGMHRRGVGAGAIAKKKLAEAKYKERGTVLAEDQLTQMSKQLDMFKTNLEEFASKHKQEIRKNPEFRVQFQDMCATIGVDPLASGKGFWSEMLGVGDFYYELGVQVIEVCLALKHRNGGLITLEELHQQVLKGRGKFAQDVSQDDLLRAIKKLKALGSGFGIIPVGGTYLIQSVPAELNMDHTVVLQLAEKNGYVTVSEIRASLKWETERARQVLLKFRPRPTRAARLGCHLGPPLTTTVASPQEHLLKEGLAWLDLQAVGEAHYWLPALFADLYSQEITAEEASEALP